MKKLILIASVMFVSNTISSDQAIKQYLELLSSKKTETLDQCNFSAGLKSTKLPSDLLKLVYDYYTNEKLIQFDSIRSYRIKDLKISPNGKFIVLEEGSRYGDSYGRKDVAWNVYKIANKKLEAVCSLYLKITPDYISSISNDGNQIASCSYDGKITLYQIIDQNVLSRVLCPSLTEYPIKLIYQYYYEENCRTLDFETENNKNVKLFSNSTFLWDGKKFIYGDQIFDSKDYKDGKIETCKNISTNIVKDCVADILDKTNLIKDIIDLILQYCSNDREQTLITVSKNGIYYLATSSRYPEKIYVKTEYTQPYKVASRGRLIDDITRYDLDYKNTLSTRQ